MAKFCVGDVVVCINPCTGIIKGSEYSIVGLFDSNLQSYNSVSLSGKLHAWFYESCFELASPKQSLQELYNIEADKLHEQAAKVDAAWRLLQSEKLLEQNARKALLHAKQVEVDTLRDHLNKVSDTYHKATIELDEMLRNEPF